MKNFLNQLPFKIKITCFVILSFLFYIPITNAQDNKDSKGKDFWLMFDQSSSPALKLFITAPENASGTVSAPGVSFSTPFSVTANTVTSITVPVDLSYHTSDIVDDKGIHVTSDKEVTVYGLSYQPFTTDAYLGLPTDVLGTDYIVLTYKNSNIVNGSEFGIVAAKNNTTVTIIPSVTSSGRTAGVPYNISLNQGQTYELANTDGTGDLTGTLITSDKEIGVFGAHQCANIPGGYTYCDHICEMLPPVDVWGKKFGTVPLASRINGDTWRFLASDDNTIITINGVAQAPINKGQFIEKILTDQSIIESDKPILVAQYSNGSSYSGNPGDPFMMLIPPLEQFLPNYTLTTVSGYVTHYINVIAPNSVVGTLTLDGAPVPAGQYTPIGSTGYSGVQLAVNEGSHTLNASSPFGAFQYGFNNDDSYGYPGGQSFVPIPPDINNLSLTPEMGTGAVNTKQCFTALVTKQNNDPVVGVTVVFNILGANGGENGYDVTDANGKAEFCYDGPMEGKDTIVATFGILNDTSYFTRTGGSDNCMKFCLVDSYRNKWSLCGKKDGSMGMATGTVNIGEGMVWDAWGWINCNTGRVELHAINPQPDNCASGYTDSFVYRGITPMKCNMGNVHIGGARWTSYCNGSVAGRGLVAAVNCGITLPGGFSGDVITPARSGGADAIALKTSPNPVQQFTTISYKLAKESKVNIVVYNYMMQPVKTLFSGTKGAGNQTVTWDAKRSNGSAAGSGLYKIVAIIDGKSYTTTVQVIK